MYSQNGYKACDSSLVASYTVVRDVKLALRKGDVSVVLLHFARWFNQNIESLTAVDCGSYNPRHVAGSRIISNHASATAMDLNWRRHVRGKKNTFTAAQQKKIRAQLKYYDGVIRWGGDYKSAPTDDMHFEINANLAAVKRAADKIRDDANPNPSLIITGKLDRATIRRWQTVMGTPVDGVIDLKDSALIRAVQRRLQATVDHRIVVDGVMGKQTIAGLQRYLKSPVDGFISTPISEMVKALQRRLNTNRF